jgi:GNAT superfamily N-acetyltransferase
MNAVQYMHSISVADFNRLRKAVGWSEIDPGQAQRSLDGSDYIVAAVCDGETVGTARVITDGGYVALISDVIVLPGFQQKGIGKTMMGMVMDHIRGGIKTGERVLINLMAAKDKEAFYKRFGFDERPGGSLGAGMTMWANVQE